MGQCSPCKTAEHTIGIYGKRHGIDGGTNAINGKYDCRLPIHECHKSNASDIIYYMRSCVSVYVHNIVVRICEMLYEDRRRLRAERSQCRSPRKADHKTHMRTKNSKIITQYVIA